MKYNKNTLVKPVYPIEDNIPGAYYLDLTSTIIDYNQNRYGEFDNDGIPKIGMGKNSYYNPVVIMNYGLIAYTNILKKIEN